MVQSWQWGSQIAVKKYLLPVGFSKVVTLRILQMEFAFDAQFQCISSGYKLAMELRTINLLILRVRLEYEIPVYSNYAGLKYEEFE